MATQVSLIQFTGKLAQTVGFRGANGKNLLRERLITVANPQTPDQVAQRARFKLTSQVSGMLGDLGKVVLIANGTRSNARGTLNKLIMPNVSANTNGEALLNHVMQLVQKPITPDHQISTSVEIQFNPQISVVTGIIEGMQEGDIATKALLIYNKKINQWINVSRTGRESTITVPVRQVAEGDINVYFYAVIASSTTEKGRAIYDSVTGPDENYRLLAERLGQDNFNYSRMLTAANIEGEESTDVVGFDETTYNVTLFIQGSGSNVPVNIVGNSASGRVISVDLTLNNGPRNVITELPTGTYRVRSTDSNWAFADNAEFVNPTNPIDIVVDSDSEVEIYARYTAS